MARNKAIFDADIIINLIDTDSIEYIIGNFEEIFISDYVFDNEIKDDSQEKQLIRKLTNTKKIKILYFQKLTPIQKKIYKETYQTLKNSTYNDMINEGERVTASFANAHRVQYYMSDDNKAAPHITYFTNIEIVNFCDLLYISLYIEKSDNAHILQGYYKSYISIFAINKIPRTIKNIDNSIKTFQEMMAKCFDKFHNNDKLTAYLDLLNK